MPISSKLASLLVFLFTVACYSIYNAIWKSSFFIGSAQDHFDPMLLRQIVEQGSRLAELSDRLAVLEQHSHSIHQKKSSLSSSHSPSDVTDMTHMMARLKQLEDQLTNYSIEIQVIKTIHSVEKSASSVSNVHSRDTYPPKYSMNEQDGHHNIQNNKDNNINASFEFQEEVHPRLNGTVVTAYFEIPSKHSKEYYLQWMESMLAIGDPMVVFTTSDWVDTIRRFRRHALHRTTIINVRLQDLPMATNFNISLWEKQFSMDPIGRFRKSFQLYWIWLSKTFFVSEAIRQNPYGASHYMWMDIGCFRNGKMFANQIVMRHLEVIPPTSILFLAHREPAVPSDPWFTDSSGGSSVHFFTSGSSFAGTKESLLTFHQRFLETLTGYMERGLFVGEDQILLQSTCLQNYGLCKYVKCMGVKDNNYFGLRTVVRFGNIQNHYYWTPPPMTLGNSTWDR